MKIAVLHDALLPRAAPDQEDNLIQAQEVLRALSRLGHLAWLLPFLPDLETVSAALVHTRPDLVFNLVESPLGKGKLIHLAPLLLERLGLAFTGSGFKAMLRTSHKLIAKKMMVSAGLPTPAWIEKPAAGSSPGAGPWLAKSVWEHGSIGIGGDGLVTSGDAAELESVLAARARDLGGRWFAERFVEGREFNLSLLEGRRGPVVLPVAEILFEGFGPDRPRLVDYQAKWDAASFEYRHTPRTFSFSSQDRPLLQTLCRLALRCWRVFGPRGWARVDFRVDQEGNPWILEINANPCLASDAGFMAAAQKAGLSQEDVVARIVARPNHPVRKPLSRAQARG